MSGPEASGGKIGLSIASHSGLPSAAIGELAGAAERAGFGAVFVAEGHGDALALCHPVAAATARVRVGTAIANAALRPPVLTAKTAAQLDQAASGRFILGLGVGNAVMNARFGLSPFAPLRMVEEYVEVIRSVLNRDTGYDGRLFRTGMVPLDSPPIRAGLPVWLGALGPRMLALAAARADGALTYLVTPAHTAVARAALGDGFLAVEQSVVLGQDRDEFLRRAHEHLNWYTGLENYRASWLRLGFDHDDFVRGGSERLCDAIVAHGDAAAIAACVRAHVDAGADHVVLQVLGATTLEMPGDAWDELGATLTEA